MHTNRTTLALTASLLTLSMAACSNAPGETESPTTETAPPDPFQVDQPKNLGAISDPCKLLTPEQLQQLGASNATTTTDKSEWKQDQCTWRNDLLTVTVSPDTTQRLGLRFTADMTGNGKPTDDIMGYPALHYGETDGGCAIYVGTSKEEVFMVDFHKSSDKPEFSKPCEVSDKIAGMVVSNLPPA